ncbi:hypothetical protein TELCIR_25998 [Teladorsagia circumcincta]|uniref:Uncharacterized protein n=1 Tax=Teladorsagia circumcincta TaxID=45464 RepID=A0A2G9T414_TELCI|nr:hypothetical protein TELCIR_25998 [Teladorsagia circumcincta]
MKMRCRRSPISGESLLEQCDLVSSRVDCGQR